MQGSVISELGSSEAQAKREFAPSTIDRFVITVSRISGYVFMAAAVVTLGFLLF